MRAMHARYVMGGAMMVPAGGSCGPYDGRGCGGACARQAFDAGRVVGGVVVYRTQQAFHLGHVMGGAVVGGGLAGCEGS